MDLITLHEYHTYADMPSPAENDEQITQMISSASAYIEKMTGRTFMLDGPSPVAVVEIINGTCSPRVYVANAPITSVTKIEYWTGTQWNEYELASHPYTFKAGTNCIYFTQGHKFIRGFQNIKVTYTYGYVSLPLDLKLGCYKLVTHLLQEADRSGISSQNDGEQTFSYDHKIPQEVIELITRYKAKW